MGKILNLLLIALAFTGSTYGQNTNTTIINSITLIDNNLSGGGFQSDVTITEDGETVYSSADVSGIFKSTNGGELYLNINEGLKSPKVATLAITPDNDTILYAGTGDKGGSGGLFRSTDLGDTWELTSAGNTAQFAGNHSNKNDPIPDGHPRSNGDLIAIHAGTDPTTYTDDIIIAGTYKDGVKIFTEGGEVAASTVNDAGFVRSVAYDPSISNAAFAAIYFEDTELNGIYKIDFTDPANPISTLEYEALNPEGVTVLSSGHVYAAIGTAGIVKFNGTSWNLKNTGLSIDNVNRTWTAATGYLKGNNDVVYIGVNNMGGNANGENYSSIWRTVNGGNTWTPLVDAETNVSDIIYGQDYEWWFRTKAFPQAGLGRKNSVVSSIDVARGPWPNVATDDIIYVSGRGGIWKSENGGTSWNPAVYNMQATANNAVAVNPIVPNQVALANTDYVVLESSAHFTDDDISRDKPGGSESKAYDILFDSSSEEIIVGVGDRDTNSPGGGEVYKKSSSALGNPSDAGWTNTNLSEKTGSGRVRGISYGYHDGDMPTDQTILAAVEGEGVFRYFNGTWTKSNGITITDTKRSRFVWPDNENSGVVYLLDLSKGLYRSNDGGRNWSNIWACMKFKNNDFYNTGFITADDNNPTTLYVSIQGDNSSCIGSTFKVYRLTNADTGVFGNPGTEGIEDISFYDDNSLIQRPGPIVIGPNGRLWLTQQQNSINSIDAGLFVMENPITDASFVDHTTNAYKNIAIQPSGIDVSSDGYVYISQSGTGLVKIQYTEASAFTDISTSVTAIPSIIHGSSEVVFTIKVQELENIATSGPITVVLVKDDRLTIEWEGAANAIGPFPVNNSDWTYDGSHPSFHIWTSSEIIDAASSSNFGFMSIYDPQNTSGTVSYTGTIMQNSGGEINGLNNIDVETILFFSN